MWNEASDLVELPYVCTMKVHRLMCLELKKWIDRVSQIFSSIESARPRCTSGIQALCSLHLTMEKAKLLILHCSECSKLYLAITGDMIVLRCEKIRNNLELCLSQIQNMVPPVLAAKISKIVDDLKVATFIMESSDDEAGKVLLTMLKQDIAASDSVNMSEFEPLRLAALRLHITTPMAVLIEKRSIKKLLEKIQGKDPRKEKILKYLLYLVRKYGKSIGGYQTESIASQHEKSLHQSVHVFNTSEPPDARKCPLSTRLMSDPVIIAKEKTFERAEVCHLENFSSSSSIASFGSSLNGLGLQISNVSLRSSDTNCGFDHIDDGFSIDPPQRNSDTRKFESSINSHGVDLVFLSKLAALPWESQCEAVEDLKNRWKDSNQGSHYMISSSYIKPLIRFLKDARDRHDLKALRDGAQLLLTLLRVIRNEMPPLQEDAIYVLSSLLDSQITEQALAIMEVVSMQQYYTTTMILASGILPSILRILEKPISECHLLATKILHNLSSNGDIGHHIVYLDYVSKLSPFLADRNLAEYCVKILRNLCSIEEAMVAIAESDVCIASMLELLEIGTEEEQEISMDVLLSLCSHCAEYCQLVMKERTILSLVSISNNGNARGKLIAADLLQLLRDFTNGCFQEVAIPATGFKLDISEEPDDCPKRKKASKASGLLGRRLSILSKRSS